MLVSTDNDKLNLLEHLLRQRLGDERVDLWFGNVRWQIRGAMLRVAAPTPFEIDRLRPFRADLLAAAGEAFGATEVEFLVADAAESTTPRASPAGEPAAPCNPASSSAAPSAARDSTDNTAAQSAGPGARRSGAAGRKGAGGKSGAAPASNALGADNPAACAGLAPPMKDNGTHHAARPAGRSAPPRGLSGQPALAAGKAAGEHPGAGDVIAGKISAAKCGGGARGPGAGASSGRPAGRWESFVVGAGNRVPHSALQGLTENLGQASPLLLHGPTGCGKSHLLEAFAEEVRRLGAARRVVVHSAEAFTTTFLEALHGGGMPNFRRKYRAVELLVIDDLQFLQGKKSTLGELLHTMDDLLRTRGQMIFAADRPPSELTGLGAEIVARLQGGLVLNLDPPDEATRRQILAQLAARLDRPTPAEALDLLAAKLPGDVRQLRGALHRLRAVSAAYNEPITAAMAERCLADVFQAARPPVRMADIETAVIQAFGVTQHQLHSPSKAKTLSQPRMLAMWLARKLVRAPYTEIGKHFGGRTHSTVMSAEAQVNEWLATGQTLKLPAGDIPAAEMVKRLERRLGRG